VFEVPAYLQWFKLFRIFSMFTAIVYNFYYAAFAYMLYKSVF
jgi:hypothetical protein